MKRVQDEPGKGTRSWKPSAGRNQPHLRGEENNSFRTQSVQGRVCFYSTVKKFPGSKDVVDDEKDYVQTAILLICPWLLNFPYLKSCITIFFQIKLVLSLVFLEDSLVQQWSRPSPIVASCHPVTMPNPDLKNGTIMRNISFCWIAGVFQQFVLLVYQWIDRLDSQLFHDCHSSSWKTFFYLCTWTSTIFMHRCKPTLKWSM